MRRAFGYLQQNCRFYIKYDINELDLTKYKIEKYYWFVYYGKIKEETPFGAPEIKDKAVMTYGFFEASHVSCLVTRRSTSCVILYINRTLIKFFSPGQNTMETSTFGSEFVVGRIVVDILVELHYNLKMLGTKVKGPTTLFGQNQSMITNT